MRIEVCIAVVSDIFVINFGGGWIVFEFKIMIS